MSDLLSIISSSVKRKKINKVLIGGGIIVLVIIIGFYTFVSLFSPGVEPLSFSIYNWDIESHRVTVEIFDSGNKSLFNKTYEMNPRGKESYSDITGKKGKYTFKVTLILDNKTEEKTYIAEVGAGRLGVSIWLYDKAPGAEYPISIAQATV